MICSVICHLEGGLGWHLSPLNLLVLGEWVCSFATPLLQIHRTVDLHSNILYRVEQRYNVLELYVRQVQAGHGEVIL